jgi:hypothetical protein
MLMSALGQKRTSYYEFLKQNFLAGYFKISTRASHRAWIKIHIADKIAGSDVAMWSTLFALTFLIAVALSLAAIRLSL